MADNKDELKGITQKVGELIKAKRIQKELTVAQLSKISGISTAVITDLETGKNKIPNLLSFVRLAKELGLEKEFTQLIFPSMTDNNGTNEDGVKRIETFLLNYVSPSLARNIAETVYVMGSIEKMRNQLPDKNDSVPLEDLFSRYCHINNICK